MADVPVHNGSILEQEWDRVAITIAYAVVNHIQSEWDFEQFEDKVSWSTSASTNPDQTTTKLAKYFQSLNLGCLDEPHTTLDKHGKVILWYLPNLISPSQVVIVIFSLFVHHLSNISPLSDNAQT
ncbi:hypothetical protein J3A83DRAFT_4366753 [Scleroderma citrinum]